MRALFIGLLVWAMVGLPPGPAVAAGPETVIRLNQLGYVAGDGKSALVMSQKAWNGQTFRILGKDGQEVRRGTVGADRGGYGGYAHVYELTFDRLTRPGTYQVVVGTTRSPRFAVGNGLYRKLAATSLKFFRVQRCGATHPLGHAPCHLRAVVAANGPAKGDKLNMAGGWHDAGDYIRFLGQNSATLVFMLLAYDRRPDVFAETGSNRVPEVLDEARVGLDWLLGMWQADSKTLYFQVGDESDHNQWRIPDHDDDKRPAQKAYACTNGRGANMAGRTAAALALAARIWSRSGTRFRDVALAKAYRQAAEEIYAFGKRNRAAQPQTFNYQETTWADDMVLAAAALYQLTGDAAYRTDAAAFMRHMGESWGVSAFDMSAPAYYLTAKAVPALRTQATRRLGSMVKQFRQQSAPNMFDEALDELQWGSLTEMTGRAVAMLWHDDLTRGRTNRYVALLQRDYALGRNPWGMSFVAGIGSRWPRHPHHQIAHLKHHPLTGFWNEGPMPSRAWKSMGIKIGADPLAAFQSAWAVYHDDVEDYATNEPTVFANGVGIALAAWSEGRRSSASKTAAAQGLEP